MPKARTAVMTLNAKKIKRECALRGWNQEALARQSGLSRPTISIAIRGGDVSARTARMIAEAFERVSPTLDGLARESA